MPHAWQESGRYRESAVVPLRYGQQDTGTVGRGRYSGEDEGGNRYAYRDRLDLAERGQTLTSRYPAQAAGREEKKIKAVGASKEGFKTQISKISGNLG
jgi:hypothetical protein